VCLDCRAARERAEGFLKALAGFLRDFENLYGWDVWSEPQLVQWVFHPGQRRYVYCYCRYSVERFREWLRELEGAVETQTGNPTVTSPYPFAPMCPLVDAGYSTLSPGDYVRVGPNHYSLCVKAGRLPKWRPSWLPTVSG